MSKHFGDIGKDAKDLLTTDFPADGTFKVITQSKTSTGVTFKATLNRFFKKDKSGPKEIISAVIEPKYEWKDQNLEFTAKLATTNEFSAGFSVKDLVGQGSKVEVTGSQSDRDGASAQLVGSYKAAGISTKVSVGYPFGAVGPKKEKKPLKINGEAVIQYPTNLFLASNVVVDVDSENTSMKGDGIVGYSQDQWQFTARGSHDRKSDITLWGLSFFHKVSDGVKWALDFDADQAWIRGPIASVGGEYKLDDSTTIKGKWAVKLTEQSKQTEMRVGVSARQKISPFISVTLGSDLNVRNLLGDSIGDAHSFGFELKAQD